MIMALVFPIMAVVLGINGIAISDAIFKEANKWWGIGISSLLILFGTVAIVFVVISAIKNTRKIKEDKK